MLFLMGGPTKTHIISPPCHPACQFNSPCHLSPAPHFTQPSILALSNIHETEPKRPSICSQCTSSKYATVSSVNLNRFTSSFPQSHSPARALHCMASNQHAPDHPVCISPVHVQWHPVQTSTQVPYLLSRRSVPSFGAP